MTASPELQFLIRKLERRSVLDDADRAAILALPFTVRTYQPSAYLVREGEPPKPYCSFITAGFAFRQKLTAEGARQIVSFHLPGDILDLQNLFLTISDHSIQALGLLEVVEIPRESMQKLALDYPGVGRGLWIDGLIDASVFREWVLNVGRRPARAQIAHILCEFAVRMQAAGIATVEDYELPMNQEQLGDAVGLTSVHVNRTLRSLVADGLIKYDRRKLSILDWDGIREVGDFSSLYLHLDQVAMNGRSPVSRPTDGAAAPA